jgi:hypothetical protein
MIGTSILWSVEISLFRVNLHNVLGCDVLGIDRDNMQGRGSSWLSASGHRNEEMPYLRDAA